jgi:hypothetical protein
VMGPNFMGVGWSRGGWGARERTHQMRVGMRVETRRHRVNDGGLRA